MSLAIQTLERILIQAYPYGVEPLPQLNYKTLAESPYLEEAQEVFHSLGGLSENLSLPRFHWQLSLESVVIQWDDALHFNRYRRTTLRTSFYDSFGGLNKMKYLDICRKQEDECLKAGMARSAWHHKAAAQTFGASEDPGDLGGKGSAGWKYRAWTDFVQDVTAKIHKVPFLRCSPWDELLINKKLVKLGDLLLSPSEDEMELLLKNFQRRIEKA